MADTAQVGQSAFLTIVSNASPSAQVGQSVYLIVLIAAPIVSCNNPPDGQFGLAYSHALSVSGGTAPYTWAISSGALPTGLSLNAATGAITGVPSAGGTFAFTVQVTDSITAVGTVNCSITILPAAITITFRGVRRVRKETEQRCNKAPAPAPVPTKERVM